MQKIIIFGVNALSEIVIKHLHKWNDCKVVAVTVDREYCSEKMLENGVIPFDEIEKKYVPIDHKVLVCLGYKNMNELRKQKISEIRSKGYTIGNFIHEKARIDDSVSIGEGNIILDYALIEPFVQIGEGNIIWSASHIAHHSKMGNYNYISPEALIAGNVTIGNNCFMGANCTIKDGINIADRSLIGAGAYISKNTHKSGVYVPPRTIELENISSEKFF